MSNNFAGVERQHWANELQETLEKELLAVDVAKMVDIPDGTVKHLPLLESLTSSEYTKGQAIEFQDITTGADTITIDKTPHVAFEINDIEKQDNYVDVVPQSIQNIATRLREHVDGNFLAEVENADYTLSADGLKQTTGTEAPLVLTTGASQNVTSSYGDAMDHLVDIGVGERNVVVIADPRTIRKFSEVGLDKGFTVADENLKRGMSGTFIGMPIYRSSLLKHTAVLALATNPTAGDTVSVREVTFTFVASIGTTAGNVLIGADADATRANLAAAINGSAGAGTTYVAFNGDAAVSLEGLTATNDNSANTLTIVSKRGSLRAYSALTAAADKFGAESANTVVMSRGAIHLALRRQVEIETDKELVANRYFIYSRYGVKTTTAGKKRMVRVLAQTKAAE